jgi:hypothetical protein
LELAPSNEYDCFTQQCVAFIPFRGLIWPAHFCIRQPCMDRTEHLMYILF